MAGCGLYADIGGLIISSVGNYVKPVLRGCAGSMIRQQVSIRALYISANSRDMQFLSGYKSRLACLDVNKPGVVIFMLRIACVGMHDHRGLPGHGLAGPHSAFICFKAR